MTFPSVRFFNFMLRKLSWNWFAICLAKIEKKKRVSTSYCFRAKKQNKKKTFLFAQEDKTSISWNSSQLCNDFTWPRYWIYFFHTGQDALFGGILCANSWHCFSPWLFSTFVVILLFNGGPPGVLGVCVWVCNLLELVTEWVGRRCMPEVSFFFSGA